MLPESIVAGASELACEFDAQLSELERHKLEAYQLLIHDTPDAGVHRAFPDGGKPL